MFVVKQCENTEESFFLIIGQMAMLWPEGEKVRLPLFMEAMLVENTSMTVMLCKMAPSHGWFMGWFMALTVPFEWSSQRFKKNH